MPEDKSGSGKSRRVKNVKLKNGTSKRDKSLTYLYEVREKLDSINSSMKEVINDNRKIRLNLPGCYVKLYRKPEKLKQTFGDVAIIDPDMILYVDEDVFDRAALAVQIINNMLRTMDLSSYSKIIKSASTIKQTLISELDKENIDYVFI